MIFINGIKVKQNALCLSGGSRISVRVCGGGLGAEPVWGLGAVPGVDSGAKLPEKLSTSCDTRNNLI